MSSECDVNGNSGEKIVFCSVLENVNKRKAFDRLIVFC